jgi:hypothetical protein
MKRALAYLFIIFSVGAAMSATSYAQCYSSMMLATDYFQYDHLVRLAVHFGDPSSIPSDVVCCRSMLPGDTHFEVPIYAYNLHEGIQYLEFGVESNESLGVFIPDGCFSMVASAKSRVGDRWRMDLALQSVAPCCGPVHVGSVEVERVVVLDPVWIDLRPNGQTGKMYAIDAYGQPFNVLSPRHGGYIGQKYLYACQPPICEEPNSPVLNFIAEKAPACAVKLSWTAGSGNRTMIRYRLDQYPTGYQDGQLAVEVPSSPGQSQFYYHTGIPNQKTVYYKAFSLTRDASDNVVRNSIVECSSADTTYTQCEIAVKPVSWGAIKNLYR